MTHGLLQDRVVVVTGAGSGIGQAAAELFADEGAVVVVLDRNAEAVHAIAREIVAKGGTATALPCDVADFGDVTGAVAEIVRLFGRLDGAFNNAGIAPPAVDTAELSPESWQGALDVNLTGVWHCMRAELGVMQAGAAIVNTSSVAGMVGLPGSAAYSATKHGVVGLTRSVAAEYGPRGIRVNAIAPGLTRTKMVETLIANGDMDPDAVTAHSPLRRMAEPKEIAESALWLLSDRSSFVTGHVLAVDGGELAI